MWLLVCLPGYLILGGGASFFIGVPAVFAASASTQEAASINALMGKTIEAIEFQGLKRIEKEAVAAKIGTKVGQPLSREQIRSDIHAIFALGHFDDIDVQAELAGKTVKLIYRVKERPVIIKVEFEGNDRISSSDLKDVIKVKEWAILDINKVREDTSLIQKHYEEKGYYLAKVNYEIKTEKADEVELIYHINDYDKIQIKKITFLNNKRFTDEQLRAVFQETKEGGFLSGVSGTGNFKESSFKQDLQRLSYWYLDHGYIKFRYESPIVTVSDDKKWLYISLYMDEGDAYKMGKIDFGGDLLFSKEELGAELLLKEGETFSISKRNFDIQRLTEKYQDLGYAFVNVIPKMKAPNDVTKTVDTDYAFEKGNLVYFGEINIIGNTKTHDKVIRRELKIHEGELYSGSKLRISRENVERLGYFTAGEVIFNTITPKGKLDILNVEISVKERSTGTITLGAGYGSVQKFFFQSTISEINFLGRGQTLSLSAMYAADRQNQSVNLGLMDPYAFDSLWSTGADVYYVNFPITNTYTTHKLGFDLRLGHPIADYINAYITYKCEALHLEDIYPLVTQDEVNADTGILSSITWSIIRDKRNNRFETTGGNYQSVSLETAGIGGDKKFIKLVLNNRYYTRLLGDLVFRTDFETGNIFNLMDHVMPPSERFYLGGPNNMKGFDIFRVGPYVSDALGNTRPLGGQFELFSLFELEYPLIREAGLKFVTFFDIGNVFDHFPVGGETFSLRADMGMGIRWFSPIGPLRFEWGFPINAKPNERNPVFNFFIGPPF